ncbi:hypothetical protein H8784_08630 [Parabacteroides acidifaciens]|uniref:Uncharacterized protein n=1 Tax=Parabacteroides acidifaciens TaxID=2290935 RepID=A0A3D8HEW3_9BACT|nr:hypothetical protein [Parabacteroides acidifaciens]MBC8601786.1 hypothetical protein [Parabacteroides acidifaciens]RDU49478.1 hypothetical protein DWU89_08835 [Parabacteroides acidifaciens]
MTTKPYKYDEDDAREPQRVSEPEEEEEDLMPGGVPALQFTREELIAALQRSEEDRQAGRVYTSAEVHRRMEEKFPFLCKE